MRKARKWREIEITEKYVYVDGILFGRAGSIQVWGKGENRRIRILRAKNDYGQSTLQTT